MTITITPEDVLDQIDRAIEKRGADYIYPRQEVGGVCQYVLNGEPSCLVGEVLIALGVPVEDFHEKPIGGGFGGTNTRRIAEIIPELDIVCDTTVTLMLSHAQDVQDRGQSWKYARVEAGKTYAFRRQVKGAFA